MDAEPFVGGSTADVLQISPKQSEFENSVRGSPTLGEQTAHLLLDFMPDLIAKTL